MEKQKYVMKITTVGNSAGVVIPKDLLERLRLQKGDSLQAFELPDGGFEIRPYNEEFAGHWAVAEAIMHEDREILKKLAE